MRICYLGTLGRFEAWLDLLHFLQSPIEDGAELLELAHELRDVSPCEEFQVVPC